MSVKITVDGEAYTGVDTIEVGGKTLAVESEVSAPSGTKNITANGTYDVSAFAQAVVNVPTDGESPVLQEKTVTITENGTTKILPDAGNDGMTAVNVTVNVEASSEEKTDYYEFISGLASNSKKDVALKHHGKVLTGAARSSAYDLFWADATITVDDELQEIDTGGLWNIGSTSGSFKLQSNNNFENLTKLGASAFLGSGITEANFGEVTTLAGVAGGQFNKCAKLTTIILPKVTAWTACMAPLGTTALKSVQIGSVGYGITAVPANGDFSGATDLTETLYTTGEYVDTILAAMRSGQYGNATAIIVIKASADTTYNGQSYAAGDTITTSTPEEA